MDTFSSLFNLKSLSPRASTPLCWIIHNGDYTVAHNNSPCGGSSDGTAFCCAHGDECTENSICHFTNSLPGTAGYYVGGCTDPTFSDPVCSKQCTEYSTQDITYNSTTGLWSCCWSDGGKAVDCSHPGNQTFQALPLTALSAEPSYGATLPSSCSTISTSSASISLATRPSGMSQVLTSSLNPGGSTDLPSSPSAQSHGLSTGAKVGIAVPVTIVGLALLGVLAFFLRRRSIKGQQTTPIIGSNASSNVSPSLEKHGDGPVFFSEIITEIRPELDGKPQSELQARSLSRREAP